MQNFSRKIANWQQGSRHSAKEKQKDNGKVTQIEQKESKAAKRQQKVCRREASRMFTNNNNI